MDVEFLTWLVALYSPQLLSNIMTEEKGKELLELLISLVALSPQLFSI